MSVDQTLPVVGWVWPRKTTPYRAPLNIALEHWSGLWNLVNVEQHVRCPLCRCLRWLSVKTE